MFDKKYSYHIEEPLNLDKMNVAAQLFIGTQDFKAATSDKRTKKSTVKTMHSITITDDEGMIEIQFHGSSFLYNMVRIITGTLIEAGLGKLRPSEIRQALQEKNRSKIGFTAPPRGLFLNEVIYTE